MEFHETSWTTHQQNSNKRLRNKIIILVPASLKITTSPSSPSNGQLCLMQSSPTLEELQNIIIFSNYSQTKVLRRAHFRKDLV
jgi:hypothetical protein